MEKAEERAGNDVERRDGEGRETENARAYVSPRPAVLFPSGAIVRSYFGSPKLNGRDHHDTLGESHVNRG